MSRDFMEAILATLLAVAICFAWFTLGDVIFPEASLGKVVFTLVPAVVTFAFWKLERNQ